MIYIIMMDYVSIVGGAEIMNNIKHIPDNYRRCIMCGRPITSYEYDRYSFRCKDCWRCSCNG